MGSPWTLTATPARLPTGTCAITNHEWRPFVADVEGRFVEASNATLLGSTADGEPVIYKPIAGARPLWDFDVASLAAREVWTYRLDAALGFDLVPETVIGDGVYGLGAVQRLIEGVADASVVDMINSVSAALWPVAVLDVLVNNADRKAGHILRDADDRLWAIDHGLSFHVDDKLRTVLWGFAGQPLPPLLLAAVATVAEKLSGDLGKQFAGDLSSPELHALEARVAAVLEAGSHPVPPIDRPAVPWPPY